MATKAWPVAVAVAVLAAVGSGTAEAGETLESAAAEATGVFEAVGRLPPVASDAPPLGEGTWLPADPDDEPPESDPAAPERGGFWDRLQHRALDHICDNISLGGAPRERVAGVLGVGGRFERRLERTPSRNFALVDRVGVAMAPRFRPTVLGGPEGRLFASVGASIGGDSIVVRPLGSKRSCQEMGRLFDLLDVKAALPLSPERIAAMEVGEVWKLSLAIQIGVGAGTGLGEFPASVWLSRGKEGRTSASLFRMAPDALRLRLRFDKADLRERGGKLRWSAPAAALGVPIAESVLAGELARLVDEELAHALSRWLTASLRVAQAKRMGRQVVLEYVVDPRQDAALAALRAVLRGDLNGLTLLGELAARAGRSVIVEPDAREEAAAVAARHDGGLGLGPSLVAADDYRRRSRAMEVRVPVLGGYDHDSRHGRDRIMLLDGRGTWYTIRQAVHRDEGAFLDLPLLGEMVKRNSERAVQVITGGEERGEAAGPAVVFVRQHGFLRAQSTSARSMVEEADDVSSLVGVGGQGRNERARLPVDALFPKESLQAPRKGTGPEAGEFPSGDKTYRRGLSVFTLVLERKAVADMLAAPSETVRRAFVNALGDYERSLVVGAGGADALSGLKPHDALEALGYSSWQEQGAPEAMSTLSALSRRVERLVHDLSEARAAPTPGARAKAVLRLLSGNGRSGMAYEDVLKVLVQLVDPADVSGEFAVSVDKKLKGEEDIRARLLFNGGVRAGSLVSEASRARTRFAEPSVLTD